MPVLYFRAVGFVRLQEQDLLALEVLTGLSRAKPGARKYRKTMKADELSPNMIWQNSSDHGDLLFLNKNNREQLTTPSQGVANSYNNLRHSGFRSGSICFFLLRKK